MRDQFIQENMRIGEQLMADKAVEKREGGRLGYGNQGVLLISSFNIPTVTMTSMWKRGTVDGQQRSALFPRRPKPQGEESASQGQSTRAGVGHAAGRFDFWRRPIGIRHFMWNLGSETAANYRGIPAFSAIWSGNLQ